MIVFYIDFQEVWEAMILSLESGKDHEFPMFLKRVWVKMTKKRFENIRFLKAFSISQKCMNFAGLAQKHSRSAHLEKLLEVPGIPKDFYKQFYKDFHVKTFPERFSSPARRPPSRCSPLLVVVQ